MSLLSRPASTTYTSLTFVTVGALTDVWSGVWWWYLREYSPDSRLPFLFCYGFLLTGLVLFIIGLSIGQLGRAARSAELPPSEVTPSVALTEETAARNPNPAVVAAPVSTAPISHAPAPIAGGPDSRGVLVASVVDSPPAPRAPRLVP